MARQSFNAGTAPSGIGGDTNKTINTKWEANFTELYKAMGAVFGGVNSGAPGAVLPTALPIANGGTGATTQVAAAKALLPAAATGQFLKYDGTNWIASADNNTTYSNMSTAEITAGTGTTGRLITPKDLKTAVGTYNAASATIAAAATKLETERKIHGVDFDGTADIDIPAATTTATGVVKLVNDLTTGGTGDALTAEMGKWLFTQFDTGAGEEYLYFKIPNKNNTSQPIIVIIGTMASEIVASNVNMVYFPFAFPNGYPRVFICNGDGVAARNSVISVSQTIQMNGFGWISNINGPTRVNYIAIGV